MPRADAAVVKYWLQDYDTDEVSESPPVQNTWYEVFHAEDVRLLWCTVYQSNDEIAAKDIEIRWTIDGNVYLETVTATNATEYYVYRSPTPSFAGTSGLDSSTSARLGTYYTDKRGLDFKVEVRMTSVLGTNQLLRARCVRETLELT